MGTRYVDPYRDRGLDKRPLMVPPTLAKTEFFRGEFIEAQWRRAAMTLGNAEALYFVVYSAATMQRNICRHLRRHLGSLLRLEGASECSRGPLNALESPL